MKKAILFVNQFFAGVGGEGQADFEPVIMEGPIGPGIALQAALRDATITYTLACGDNYMNSNKETALAKIQELLDGKPFDIFLAGPAFQSGRYGMSCGALCQFVSENYKVPVVTCMHEESPGVDAYRENPNIYIMKGHKGAVKMRDDISAIAKLANKFIADERILWAEEEGYFGHGIRKEVFVDKTASERAVEMLLAKISGKAYETEYKIEIHDAVTPADGVKNIRKCKIALINSGGLVPVGNPDRMPSGTASIWKTYPIAQLEAFLPGEFYSVHGGFSTDYVNADPEALMPLRTVKELLKEGAFGMLEPFLYTTTGNLTSLKDARRMGNEIAEDLKNKQVDAAIYVST